MLITHLFKQLSLSRDVLMRRVRTIHTRTRNYVTGQPNVCTFILPSRYMTTLYFRVHYFYCISVIGQTRVGEPSASSTAQSLHVYIIVHYTKIYIVHRVYQL